MNSLSFIQLYPTLRCNQGCSFCFNQNIPGAALQKDMREKDAYALLEILGKAGVREIDVLGGEPFLVPWMTDFARQVTDLQLSLNISTNGSLPDVADDFTAIHADLLNIGFSVHGFSEMHNTSTVADNFPKAINGIMKLLGRGKNPIVKSVLTRENKKQIHDLILYLKELGVRRYYLLHEDIIGRKQDPDCFSFPEFWDYYAALKKDLEGICDIGFVAASGFYKYGNRTSGRCDAGITKIAIMPDGSAFPCNLFFGFPEFMLGNVFEDGIENIWNSPVLETFRNYTGNICNRTDCKHYSTCTGGCPAHSYASCHDLHVTDPRCATAKGYTY
jgi:radical SAM protein with 4Fe4S-binding SPASM domain